MNEMILRESEDENILDYSENIRSAGKTLLYLINSILDFSKIEDGKMEIIPVRYETVSVIKNMVNSVSERAKVKKLDFRINVDPQLPRELIGDDVRVTQVVVNLLTNAVKYTEQGSVTLDISIKEMTDSEIVLGVSVNDTGIGIREEDLDKLFDSFTRLETTRNRNIEGTGLGMAIVTKLLALMDSKLEVHSVYGEGSEFSFELKQDISDPSPIGNALEHHLDHSGKKKKVYKQYSGAKVLVTDDNDMNLKVAGNLLRLFGIAPDLADSGEQTIRLMRNTHYDLVFLDHMMPKMDGIETLEKLRSLGQLPQDTAVIALTANAVLGAKEKYLAEGFSDYLSKPIELDELAEKLAAYLSGYESSGTGDAHSEKAADSEPETQTDRDEQLAKLGKLGLNVSSGLVYCTEDAAFYKEMLADYAMSCEKRLAELDQALGSKDMKLYRTYIHALKSASRSVGADDVSELAKELEKASERGDIEFVAYHGAELEKRLLKRSQQIKKVFEVQ